MPRALFLSIAGRIGHRPIATQASAYRPREGDSRSKHIKMRVHQVKQAFADYSIFSGMPSPRSSHRTIPQCRGVRKSRIVQGILCQQTAQATRISIMLLHGRDFKMFGIRQSTLGKWRAVDLLAVVCYHDMGSRCFVCQLDEGGAKCRHYVNELWMKSA